MTINASNFKLVAKKNYLFNCTFPLAQTIFHKDWVKIYNVKLIDCETNCDGLSITSKMNYITYDTDVTITGTPKQTGIFNLVLNFDIVFDTRIDKSGRVHQYKNFIIEIHVVENFNYQSLNDSDKTIENNEKQNKTTTTKSPMWNEVEPIDLKHPKPHTHFYNEHIYNHNNNGISIIAGSIRGRSHAHQGKYREDDMSSSLLKFDENIFVAISAVCDGCGSSKYSRLASKIVSETFVQVMTDKIKSIFENYVYNHTLSLFNSGNKDALVWIKKLMLDGVSNTGLELIKCVKNESNSICANVATLIKQSLNHNLKKNNDDNFSLKDYHTTINASVVFIIDDNVYIVTYNVGDGITLLLKNDALECHQLNHVHHGEYAGETKFFTENRFLNHSDISDIDITIVPLNEFKGLMIMTDGVSDPLYYENMTEQNELLIDVKDNEGCNLKDIMNQIKNNNEQISIENWLKFVKRGHNDDRSLMIIIPSMKNQ